MALERGIIFIWSIDMHIICEPIQNGDLGIWKLTWEMVMALCVGKGHVVGGSD